MQTQMRMAKKMISNLNQYGYYGNGDSKMAYQVYHKLAPILQQPVSSEEQHDPFSHL